MPFITRKHRAALPLSAAIVTAGLAATPAMGGCNSGNVANTDLLSSANCQASAAGINALAVGIVAQASGVSSTAIGIAASASDVSSTAVGSSADASGARSAAYGSGSTASAAFASAYGDQSVASGFGSSAYGVDSLASGNFSSAYGSSTASGVRSTASGASSLASGVNSSAYGNQSTASGDFSSAYGVLSNASGASSVAIGSNASATAANSVAIGAGSVASAPNTVSVGSAGNERRITNVAAGFNPTDAVNVSQLSSIAAGVQSQIDGLQRQVIDNQREARGGSALALAASGLWFDPRPGKVSVATAFGNFKGVSGLALGIGYAPTANWRFNGAVTAVPETGDLGVRAGASWTLN
jgi:trimeric autotransporter adhesin